MFFTREQGVLLHVKNRVYRRNRGLLYEPIKQFIKAIKFAIEEGKWGRVFGAIGTLIVGAVLSFIPGMAPFIYTIMSTVVSMATAICYGQYKAALKSFAIGVATAILQYAAQVVTSVVKGIMTGLTKVKDVFISIKNTAVNIWTTAVDEAAKFANRAWLFAKNTVLGFTTTGVSRYFTEEINKNASWGAKIGYAFAGAYALTGISALTNSNFGANWCDGNITTSLHIMTELAFGAMGMIASTEVYKELEDEWEEEWYRDFMFASINTMVSTGFGIVKDAVHQAIGDIPYKIQADRDRLKKEFEDTDKKVEAYYYSDKQIGQILVKDADGNTVKRINYYGNYSIEIDYENNTAVFNGKEEYKLIKDPIYGDKLIAGNEEIWITDDGMVDFIVVTDANNRAITIDFDNSTGEFKNKDIWIDEDIAKSIWGREFGQELDGIIVNGEVKLSAIKNVYVDYNELSEEDLGNFIRNSLIRISFEIEDVSIIKHLDTEIRLDLKMVVGEKIDRLTSEIKVVDYQYQMLAEAYLALNEYRWHHALLGQIPAGGLTGYWGVHKASLSATNAAREVFSRNSGNVIHIVSTVLKTPITTESVARLAARETFKFLVSLEIAQQVAPHVLGEGIKVYDQRIGSYYTRTDVSETMRVLDATFCGGDLTSKMLQSQLEFYDLEREILMDEYLLLREIYRNL